MILTFAKYFVLAALIVTSVIIISAVRVGPKHAAELQKQCEAAKGVIVKTRDGSICMQKEAVIPLAK